jgi:hypothetical protein
MVEVGRREPYENPLPSWEVRGGTGVGVWESRAHQDEDCWRRPPAFGNEPEYRYAAHAQAVHREGTVDAEEMGRKAPNVCEEMDQRGRAGCGESVRRVTHGRNCHQRWPKFRADDVEVNASPRPERARGQAHGLSLSRFLSGMMRL